MNMRVICWLDGGTYKEIEVIAANAKEALELAKKELGTESENVTKWEIQEDFV